MPSRSEEKRLTLQRPESVVIQEVDVAKMLAEIPDLHRSKARRFEKWEDEFILAGWGVKAQTALARKLGCSVATLRRRHDELLALGS